MALAILARTLLILMGLSSNYGQPVDEEWPVECRGRYYCWKKPNSYPDTVFEKLLLGLNMTTELGGGLSNRTGLDTQDVAGCRARPLYYKQIYMIKDKDNTIWYVPQTNSFTLKIETEECLNVGRVHHKNSHLDQNKLNKKEVHCWERRVNFGFPVLSKDKTRLEIRSPYKGLPLGCSAKIIRKKYL